MSINYIMPASYWGVLAKVGPYKKTKLDQQHLHERGSNLHYTSAFTRMQPSSLGCETAPPGIQDQSAWLPKIHMGMVTSRQNRQSISGRNATPNPASTTDRDRAFYDGIESSTMLYKNNRTHDDMNVREGPAPNQAKPGTYSTRPTLSGIADELKNYLANADTPTDSSYVPSSSSGSSGSWIDYPVISGTSAIINSPQTMSIDTPNKLHNGEFVKSPASTIMGGSYYKPSSRRNGDVMKRYRAYHHRAEKNFYELNPQYGIRISNSGPRTPISINMAPYVPSVKVPLVKTQKQYKSNSGRTITRAKYLKLKKGAKVGKKVSSAQAKSFDKHTKKRGNFDDDNVFQNARKKR